MRKINMLFQADTDLAALNRRVETFNMAQQLWLAAAPRQISQHSHASSLNNGLLSVAANNGAVATKIKLLEANLLSQLHNLTLNTALSKGCKVTAISVKVQAKSSLDKPPKPQRKLSGTASHSLTKLVENLADSPLRDAIARLAKRTK